MTLRAFVACALGSVVALGATFSCGDRIQPTGSSLVVDVPPPVPKPVDDARPPDYDAGISDGSDASPYTRADADLKACDTCVCAKDTSFCFGGATLAAPVIIAGADAGDGGDAGPAICPTASGAAAQVGCNTLPPACAAKPTCACIIDTLQPLYRCYLNCADDGSKWLVYCPS